MNEYKYMVDLDDPKYPGVVRSGPNGLEAYHPDCPGKWEHSPYYDHMSQEDLIMELDNCSEEEATKYIAMIEENAKKFDEDYAKKGQK